MESETQPEREIELAEYSSDEEETDKSDDCKVAPGSVEEA
jgi:hypothetical protein